MWKYEKFGKCVIKKYQKNWKYEKLRKFKKNWGYVKY